jgi:hypothetical protein
MVEGPEGCRFRRFSTHHANHRMRCPCAHRNGHRVAKDILGDWSPPKEHREARGSRTLIVVKCLSLVCPLMQEQSSQCPAQPVSFDLCHRVPPFP